MASSKDKTKLLSTLKSISKLDNNSDTNHIQKYLNQLFQFTSKPQHISTIHTYKNGSIINILIEFINNNNNINYTHIISQSIIILGRILSISNNELFSSTFINNDGIQIIYNILSSKCNNNEIILNSLIDFLLSINKHIEIGHKQIVLNNTEYQFIFQIASILKKHISFNVINKFCLLLCKLYHQYINHNTGSDDETSDDEFDDDENNIKSIINTLIFTGFITTISKRTKYIKSDSPTDIIPMMDIILILMDANSKKTCKSLLNACIPKYILDFISYNQNNKHLLSKTLECLTKFYIYSSKNTLKILEDNNYMNIISPISNIKSKEIFLHNINPSLRSLSKSNEYEDEKNEDIMIVDISEQEDQSTVIEETEEESLNTIESPKEHNINLNHFPHNINGLLTREELLTAQPPPAQKQQPIMITNYSNHSTDTINLPPIPVISPVISPHGSNESEMELVLDAISDIQATISSLQQNMDMKTPEMVKKYVSEHHAPRYSGIEQQHYIDAETARIMAERKAEQDRLKLTEIQEVEEINDNNSEHKQSEHISQTQSQTHSHRRVKDKHRKSSTHSSYKHRKGISNSHSNSSGNGNDKLWNRFKKYYDKYIDSQVDYVENVRNVLQKLREFASNNQNACIDGLLHCRASNIVVVNFLSCLEIKDDIIRECIVEILDNLYDVADDNFIHFTNNNNVIEYLSKSLLVRHHHLNENKNKYRDNDDLFKLSAGSSARVDMKILQVLAVNFSGREILYHNVFNKIKESIMSSYQHIDFVLYALQVIKTIIEDIDNAKKWINKDCKGNVNMDHTIQFAVYVIQTYDNSEASILSKGILQSLNVDINKVLMDNNNNENKNNNNNIVKKKHHKQISNFYAVLERDQLKNSDLEYQKLREWILYIQQECDNSRINNGILSDNDEIISILLEIKTFFMKDNGSNNNEYIWKCFQNLNSISILCDLITIILMGNSNLWNKLLIGILDIIVLYIRRRTGDNDNGKGNRSDDNGYIIKCMIDILLRYLSISSKINKVMMKACGILDKMTKENIECINYAVDYGGIECIFNIIISWNSNHFNKLLIISSLHILSNLLQEGKNNKNKQIIMNNGGCQHLLNILATFDDNNNNTKEEEKDTDSQTDTDIISITFELLLYLTSGNNDITCSLILILINQYNILTVLYSTIELLQKDKKTLYLLMELLLNICSNCNKLSMDVQSWIIRIVLEFSNKYEKSPQIHSFMIKIITSIIKHNPSTNILMILSLNNNNNNNNNYNNKDIIHIFETMKLSQYKENIILLVFNFIKLICNINNDFNNYFVDPSKGIHLFKFIVHVMKNWYLNSKETIESKILVIKNCCQIINLLCNSSHPLPTNANIANQSHVTSSLIKLVIAHDENKNNKLNNTQQQKKEILFSDLQLNPYLNRISMFICILESINSLCKTSEIALKIAKHAIKTILKGIEYHILSDIGNSGTMNDTYNKQQKKLLLNVIIIFMTNIISISNSISSYLIKYDITKIIYNSIIKYSIDDLNSNDQDLQLSCKLIDFLTILLQCNTKSYNILENKQKTSKLINNILNKQTNSYRTYQPLIESCKNYQKQLKKYIHKINKIDQTHSHSPIPIIQSTTSSAPITQQQQQQQQNNNPYNNIAYNQQQQQQPQIPIQHPQIQTHPYSLPHNINNNYYNGGYYPISPQQPIQQKQPKQRRNTTPPIANTQPEEIKMFNKGSNPYHTLNTQSPRIWNNNTQITNNNNDHIANKLHSTLVQLLSSGSIMTKYPSIHTDTPNYFTELHKMKPKFKLVRISSDWQTIEFHNVITNDTIINANNKPPKVLPIGNMRHINSSFNQNINEKRFAKSKHSKELLIYALDKNGKEIVIKLICQNINDTKRWTRALNQIINHFK